MASINAWIFVQSVGCFGEGTALNINASDKFFRGRVRICLTDALTRPTLGRMNNELPVWRARKRVSQRDTAKGTGIGYDRYWRIENDHADATDDEQAALARFFECTLVDLFPGLATEQPASQETR